MLVAIQDEGSRHMSPAIDALKGLGATDLVQPDHRGSFAFAGYAGANKPQWITQRRANRGQGPSEIFPNIALSAGVFGYRLVIDFYTGPSSLRKKVFRG